VVWCGVVWCGVVWCGVVHTSTHAKAICKLYFSKFMVQILQFTNYKLRAGIG
jgi:hypothetical protein